MDGRTFERKESAFRLLRLQFQKSTELLTIELGLSEQLFLVDYSKYKDWTTDCTLKEMCHRMHRFGFTLQVHNFKLLPPRSRDKWIMLAFIEAGYSAADLVILNLVQLHQQVLFVSDVFNADGHKLDDKYLRRRPREEFWSTLIFPLQHLQPIFDYGETPYSVSPIRTT